MGFIAFCVLGVKLRSLKSYSFVAKKKKLQQDVARLLYVLKEFHGEEQKVAGKRYQTGGRN